jgi:hypothetical protein
MADETCVEVNCCPLGYRVPGLGGTLALAGDDSTATDPNIADGELVLAEEAAWVSTAFNSVGTSVLTAAAPNGVLSNLATSLLGQRPLLFSDFSNVQVGYYAYCIAIARYYTATLGSFNIDVVSTSALSTGMLLDLSFDYFPYGTTIQNIVGSTFTLSKAALLTSSVPYGSDGLFRPPTGPVKIGGLPLIPTGTRVVSVSGDFSQVTLSAPAINDMTIARSIVAFYPAELDPNVQDEDQLFT